LQVTDFNILAALEILIIKFRLLQTAM